MMTLLSSCWFDLVSSEIMLDIELVSEKSAVKERAFGFKDRGLEEKRET